MNRGSEYGRRARRHLKDSMAGPVIKCQLCKGAWLFGRQRQIGVCSRCAKIAYERNSMQMLARGVEDVVSATWSQDEWPGALIVHLECYNHFRKDIAITWEEAAAFKGDIAAWVRNERSEFLAEIHREHLGRPPVCTECGIYMDFWPEEPGDRETPGMPAEWQCEECGASELVEWADA